MTNLKPPPFHRVIVAQVSATVVFAALSLLVSGFTLGYSVFLGGLISSLSNGFFAVQAFKYRGARNAQKIVKSFLAGEIGKIGIAVVMFALCFSLLSEVIGIALMMGFLAVHVVGVFTSVTINYSPSAHRNSPSA